MPRILLCLPFLLLATMAPTCDPPNPPEGFTCPDGQVPAELCAPPYVMASRCQWECVPADGK